MKLIRKKKYRELLDTIDHYESKIKYLEGALSNLDSYSCTLRQQKYDSEKDLSYANESYHLLKNDYDVLRKREMRYRGNEIEAKYRLGLVEEELKEQKKNNRRLINLLYNPKKK
ncbi:hypothetical protein [Clostridium sp.]|uniref:hypothetical protein n=1 Tax=Clostridium sp. TaxID=1506 RepID=UPI003F3C38DC